jgi:transposase
MARRGVRLTDAQWTQIERHLLRPRRSPQGGRPRVSNRDVVDGILWVLKTGARWRDVPAEYPSGAMCRPSIRAARRAGDACGSGTRTARGCRCGVRFSASSMPAVGSVGRTRSSTARSCRRKRGR